MRNGPISYASRCNYGGVALTLWHMISRPAPRMGAVAKGLWPRRMNPGVSRSGFPAKIQPSSKLSVMQIGDSVVFALVITAQAAYLGTKIRVSRSIVAIHGLNGHRDKTWALNGKVWARDFLPERIHRARIMTWGYDARTHGRTQISRQLLFDHAINLVRELSVERELTNVSTLNRSE